MLDGLTGYWGVDWLAIVATVAGMWLLGGERRMGFVVYGVGAAAWVATGILAESWAMILGNAAFIVVNARGYLRWGKSGERTGGGPV